jgi:SAM-dependent methyltransferase
MDDHLDEHARRASSFGSRAAEYAEYRPDYPAALFEWGLAEVRDAPDLRVLDMGAGTGKLTQGLVAAGARVVAVEPDPAMLAELTSRLRDVEARQGHAEAIPLPGASVHAAFAGQALHWFDLDRAMPEFRRVLRPGGPLIAAWNAYDDREPWVAELVRIADFIRKAQTTSMLADELARFGTTTEAEFPHRSVHTVDSLVRMAGTQSCMLVAEPAERAAVLGELRRYLESSPVTAHGPFTVPIVTMAIKLHF